MAAQQEPLAQLPPGNLKYLRACLRCRLIKSQKQFEDDGCDNCREMSSRSVSDYTTPVFQGFLVLADPKTSWVARFHKLQDRLPGCYALAVSGSLGSSDD